MTANPHERQHLVYWLANEDVYTSDYVRRWLERTPPAEAADTLAELADFAQPEPRSFWYGVFRTYMVAFGTSDSVSPNGPGGRKAGTRAAMLLANMRDARAVAPLVRVFETERNRIGKYQAAIESSLLKLVSEADLELAPESLTSLRELVEKVWNAGKPGKDLSPRHSEILAAALPRLWKSGEEDGLEVINAISRAEVRTPERQRVKEAAARLISTSS